MFTKLILFVAALHCSIASFLPLLNSPNNWPDRFVNPGNQRHNNGFRRGRPERQTDFFSLGPNNFNTGFNNNNNNFNGNSGAFNPDGNQGFVGNDLSANGGFFFPDQSSFNQNNNRPRATTQRPDSTTLEIPGMGTTQSPCEDRCLTTPQYNPVCGDNTITYANPARLKCAQDCGRRVNFLHAGVCPRTVIAG